MSAFDFFPRVPTKRNPKYSSWRGGVGLTISSVIYFYILYCALLFIGAL